MFSRYIDNIDFKSRFRILKGGKISLVISAMLLGSIVNVANATNYELNIGSMSANISANGDTVSTTQDITEMTGINIMGGQNTFTTSIDHNITTYTMSIEVSGMGSDSSLTIASGKNVIADVDYGLNLNTTLINSDIINNGTIKINTNGLSGIYINDLISNGSTITNASGATIDVTGIDMILGTKGIEVDTGVYHSIKGSEIINNGTIKTTGSVSSNGIFLSDDAIDSKISNGATGSITASSIQNINTNSNITDALNLYSSGIELDRVITQTNGVETSVKNAGTIDSKSTIDLTVDGSVSTLSLKAESKGIHTIYLAGDVNLTEKPTLENSGNILATSKLGINFANTGDTINANVNNYVAIATGIESNTYKATVNNTSTGNITTLAEINIDSKGSVLDTYGTWSESNGMLFYGIAESTLTNDGIIDAKAIYNGIDNASAISRGIFVDNSDVSASTITNTKTIKSTAESSATTTDSFSRAYGVYLDRALNSTVSGGSTPTFSPSILTNTALIDVKSTSIGNTYANSESRGIFVDTLEGSSIINGVANVDNTNVKIKVESAATTTGINGVDVEARGIDVNNFKDSEIKNYGTIEVTGTATSLNNSSVNTYGISATSSEGNNPNLPFSTTDKFSILNEGTIIVKSNATVTNTVDGEIDAEAVGISAYHDVWIDSTSTPKLTIDNKGTVEAYINDKLDEYAYSMQVSGERDFISVTNSGTLRGNIEVNGTLTNSGTIELPHNATASISNYTNEGTGKLIIGLSSEGIMEDGEPVFTHSKLETRNATFENGSTIDVNVLTAVNNQAMLKGQTLKDVVKADTALNINGTLNVTDNSALLNFKYATTEGWTNGSAGAIDLVIEKGQTVLEAVSNPTPEVEDDKVVEVEDNKISTKAAPTKYKNAQDAARVFDKIIDDNVSHPEMISVIEKLNLLPSNKAVAQAVESTTPQSTVSAQTASTQISSNIANVVIQRQNPNFSSVSGTNSGDEVLIENKNLWIKPFGSIGSQADKDGLNGFDVKSYGIGMGFDGKNKNEQMVGFGLFFTDANVDMNNVSQETDLKAYSAMMYGSFPVIDSKTNFLYQLGYSLQKTDSARDVFTGETASADYTSKLATVDMRLIRDYQINNQLMLQPLAYTTYRNFSTPSYSETGAGALNLDVEKSSVNEMLVGIGTIATYKLNSADKIIGSLNVGYDLEDDKNSIISSYQGASGVNFETQGIDNGRWSYEAGLGYERTINAKNSINVNYNFQAEGSDYKNNVVSANYIYKF